MVRKPLSDIIGLIPRFLPKDLRFQMSPSIVYDKKYFSTRQQKRSLGEIQRIVKVLWHTFRAHTLVDIGCGDGVYLAAMARYGVEVTGCDGSRAAVEAADKSFTVFSADLRKSLVFNHRFDLCICFEVAEHIASRHATRLVETLTGSSDTIAFTAATPRQGGKGRINEQPHSY